MAQWYEGICVLRLVMFAGSEIEAEVCVTCAEWSAALIKHKEGPLDGSCYLLAMY